MWGQPALAPTSEKEIVESATMDDFPALGPAAPYVQTKPLLSFTQALRTESAPQPAENIPTLQAPPAKQPVESGAFSVLANLSVCPLPSSSSAPVKVLVIDANAIIRGARLRADELVTIPEVVEELKDQASRRALPQNLCLQEPSQEALKEVMSFARATGDLHSLSSADIKLIALTLTLEAARHGTSHLRSQPAPLVVQSRHNGRIRAPPGWGQVANPEEWAEIDEVGDDGRRGKSRKGGGVKSKILGVTVLELGGEGEGEGGAEGQREGLAGEGENEGGGEEGGGDREDRGGRGERGRRGGRGGRGVRGERRGKGPPRGNAVKSLEGKMSALGLDASKGTGGGLEGEEWEKAVSRSTRQKHVRRAGRREAQGAGVEAAVKAEGGRGDEVGGENESHPSLEHLPSEGGDPVEGGGEGEKEEGEGKKEEGEMDDGEGEMEGGEREREKEEGERVKEEEVGNVNDIESEREEEGEEGGEEEEQREEEMASEARSESGGGVGVGGESESGWSDASVPESTVGCMTADFAMQNVILQMGLRLITVDGVQIRELHRWVLRCSACAALVREAGRLFCPTCGNGGTLKKVSVSVGANGAMQGGLQKRFNIRGTRYSLPQPKGGREGAALNPILREDQLPKKPHKHKYEQGPDVLSPDFDTWFQGAGASSHATNHGTNAALLFKGKRNPNERRVGRNC